MSFDKRIEFVLLFDVAHGNPNGDPDAGNAPRVDPETGFGFVTDVCLKRKIRNFVALTKEYQPPYDIYAGKRTPAAFWLADRKRRTKQLRPSRLNRANEDARRWMCDNYFDVRTFGAVMTTGKSGTDEEGATKRGAKKDLKLWNCVKVRGPVQIGLRTLPIAHPVAGARHYASGANQPRRYGRAWRRIPARRRQVADKWAVSIRFLMRCTVHTGLYRRFSPKNTDSAWRTIKYSRSLDLYVRTRPVGRAGAKCRYGVGQFSNTKPHWETPRHTNYSAAPRWRILRFSLLRRISC